MRIVRARLATRVSPRRLEHSDAADDGRGDDERRRVLERGGAGAAAGLRAFRRRAKSALDPLVEGRAKSAEERARRADPAPVVPDADALTPDEMLEMVTALDAALAADDVMLAARLDTSLARLADRLSSDDEADDEALSSAPDDVPDAAVEMNETAADEAVARTDEADDSRSATVEAADSVMAVGGGGVSELLC